MPDLPLLYAHPDHFGQTPGISRTTLRRISRLGVALLAAGVVLGAAAITVLPWFRDPLDGSPTRLRDVDLFLHRLQHTLANDPVAAAHVRLGLAPAYFHGLAYLLLGATLVVTLLAAAPTRLGPALRGIAVLAAVTLIAVTLRSVELYTTGGPIAARRPAGAPATYLDWLRQTGPGAWAMLAGALCCIGAALVPARRIGR